ncbi:hypothetical protein B0T20DRAFT_225982 [Sordaria brevicollis]|uniref:Uncharacterized protein n=1 Tax=Sordaria brevicollis TaxID=83679 RepID=A0AAE0PDT4_SORBR|nr:hypothetical protein B0T20DRAFT_225982 [Sordaria brevicollis]
MMNMRRSRRNAGLLTTVVLVCKLAFGSRYMWPSWIRYSVAQPWGGCGGQRQQGGDAKERKCPARVSFQTLWNLYPPRRSRRRTCDYLHLSLSFFFLANFLSAFAAFCLARLVQLLRASASDNPSHTVTTIN